MTARTVLALALGAVVAGCATTGSAGASAEPTVEQPGRPDVTWPIKTRYHIDLWLHGYAMLQEDTTLVPYFERGYRDRMVVLKNRANVTTRLDENRDALRAGLARSRTLIGGQFLPLYFGSWEDLQTAIDIFLRAEGDPRRASDQQTRAIIATIAASYPTAADREWLRLFTLGLQDESTRYYQSYWTQQQRERSPALAVLDSLWTHTYLPKLQGYLNNTQQRRGELFVSLPLDGEGRTISGGGRSNSIAVTYPATEGEAVDAIYVFAHEVIGTLANQAVSDNTTPAEKRTGLADSYASAGAVRGGALLLQRVAPELVPGYQRYYLRAANVTAPSGEEEAVLARVFPLPARILDAIRRQLDIVLGGI